MSYNQLTGTLPTEMENIGSLLIEGNQLILSADWNVIFKGNQEREQFRIGEVH